MTRTQLIPAASSDSFGSPDVKDANFGAIGHRRAVRPIQYAPNTLTNGFGHNSEYLGRNTEVPSGSSSYTLFGTSDHQRELQRQVPFQQYQHSSPALFTPQQQMLSSTLQHQMLSSTLQQQALPSTPRSPVVQSTYNKLLGDKTNEHSPSGPYLPTPTIRSTMPMTSCTQPAVAPPTPSQPLFPNTPCGSIGGTFYDMDGPNSFHELSTALQSLRVSPTQSLPDSTWSENDVELEDSEEEEDKASLSHPNKYPVEIESHQSQHCGYRRQLKRSGPRVKQHVVAAYDPLTLQTKTQLQQVKYYKKDLVRNCRCGRYNQMDGALVHGRNNDCDGYEIHYSLKCKWKAYDDFKTGARVLIRLCKCYKPF